MRSNVLCTLLFTALGIPLAAEPAGLIGGPVTWLGDRTGIKPLQQLGGTLDQANRNLKNSGVIPGYKFIEEQGSAFVKKELLAVCAVGFQLVTKPLEANCDNDPDRMMDGDKVAEAKSALMQLRFFSADELSNVTIRACHIGQFAEGTGGVTPEHKKIYLDVSAFAQDPASFAALVAHELTHIRQYARGSDQFKCDYSRAFVGCAFCQNEGNSIEREAIQFQESAQAVLDKYYNHTPGAQPPARIRLQPQAPYSGQLVIVNTMITPYNFTLESQSASASVNMAGQSWEAFTAALTDSIFNIALTTGAGPGRPYVVRRYGLTAGGTYFLVQDSSGVVDIVANPDDPISDAPKGEAPNALDAIILEHFSAAAVVDRVMASSWAQGAGLERFDVIRQFNGQPIKTPADLAAAIQSAAGSRVSIVIFRGGVKRQLEADVP